MSLMKQGLGALTSRRGGLNGGGTFSEMGLRGRWSQLRRHALPEQNSVFQIATHPDQRPRLSASQQVQILSDVQQHQQQYSSSEPEIPTISDPTLLSYSGQSQSFIVESPTPPTTPYPSLAKYKVDRAKQNYQLQTQLQRLQQKIFQQQEQLNQKLDKSHLETAQTQYTSPAKPTQYQSSRYNTQHQTVSPNYVRDDLNQPFFSDQQTLQLQNYLEQQKQLEILQRQREQLLFQQQELRRQQELLKLEQLQRMSELTTPLSEITLPPSVLSSTNSPLLLSSPTARRITPAESELFIKAIQTHQKKFSISSTSPTQITLRPTNGDKGRQDRVRFLDAGSKSQDALVSLLQGQESDRSKMQVKLLYQTERPATSTPISDRDVLLRKLKPALAKSNDFDGERNVTTREIVLPNGKRVRVVHTSSSSSPSSVTTIRPTKAILEELTRGVLPPGADFEVIRHKEDGKLEEIGRVPLSSLSQKKVTFVVLEEQPDGSYKVQGVKGNSEKDGSVDVRSIVEKIKKGEIKLPPSSVNPSSTTNYVPTNKTVNGFKSTTDKSRFYLTSRHGSSDSSSGNYSPYTTMSPYSLSSTDKYVTSASSVSGHVFNSFSTLNDDSRLHGYSSTVGIPSATTISPSNENSSTEVSSFITYKQQLSQSPHHVDYNSRPVTSSPTPRSISSTQAAIFSSTLSDNLIHEDNHERRTSLQPEVLPTPPSESIYALLRKEGLFAMAKYLRHSGLDTVLNETGPYTIFVPTDKAFRTLLVQLGGPEKAEQKFKDNPRLLSGLVLHHVIPGAFRIHTLLDEMTGVSLAGTQLRVNVYSMHDHEWNDVSVTTINGARAAPNKRDIKIPQGVAHAIDRVMFPLPVGDIVQTLQADRERRFSTFLKLLHASSFDEMLSGSKTYTVFVPTDAAFVEAATKNGGLLWRESDGIDAAKDIVTRHIVPTTLYTAGMRYYHKKETLHEKMLPIHIQKTGGRIRINDAYIVTYNIPATNGVLHAIDAVL
ncbi:uncharacterized protein LOC117175530 [Belonocnema kinseyi]|uniref:uncharacterized protein LOC117175530 n=1 Tax=Belonocnema kinseyi TaxID=2817044 RepID=UPI00143D72E8|nr:uncharacterized protein LOC117175530 [Belonocnema kinseyi]